MAKDDETRIGRRALLAAGAGGAAIAAVNALAAPAGALAAQGGNAIIGQVNDGDDRTVFTSTKSDGVEGASQVPTKSGVYGVNSNQYGYGVFGRNAALNVTGYVGGPGHGAWGETGVDKYSGTYGRATASGAYGATGTHVPTANQGRLGTAIAGVEGQSAAGDGVRGTSAGADKSGVYGVGDDAAGFGVFGANPHAQTSGHLAGPGVGVEGSCSFGTMGQLGRSTAGAYGEHTASDHRGYVGTATSGVAGVNGKTTATGELGGDLAGVQAVGADTTPALHVAGSVVLLRSGVATVPKGKSSVVVSGWKARGTPEVAIAVPVAYRPGVGVAATVVDGTAGTVTIYLTKAVSADTRVAFFLFGGPPLI